MKNSSSQVGSSHYRTVCTICDYAMTDLDGTTGPLHRHLTTYHAQEYNTILKKRAYLKKPKLIANVSTEISNVPEQTAETHVPTNVHLIDQDIMDTPGTLVFFKKIYGGGLFISVKGDPLILLLDPITIFRP